MLRIGGGKGFLAQRPGQSERPLTCSRSGLPWCKTTYTRSRLSTQSNTALPFQAQLAEERGRRGALDAEARTKREAFTEQQAIARADAARLNERLRTAEETAEASERAASDLKAQLHVGSPSICLRPLHTAGSRDGKSPNYRP